jgi:hypothetical protein
MLNSNDYLDISLDSYMEDPYKAKTKAKTKKFGCYFTYLMECIGIWKKDPLV